MKTRALLFLFFTLTLFASGVLITTLFNTAPSTADALPLFYVSALIFLFGLLFFAGYGIYWLRYRVVPVGMALNLILRLSLAADVLLIALLAMNAANVLSWPTALVLIVAAGLLAFTIRKRLA